MDKASKLQSKQSGAVLIVSLVLLLVLSMIGIQGMQSTSLEEKMAGNFRDRAVALEAAEAALAAAQAYLNSLNTRPIPADTDFIWDYGSGDFSDPTRWANAETATSHLNVFTTNDHVWSEAPRFFIEERGLISESENSSGAETGQRASEPFGQGELWGYRISAIGTGSTPNSQVVLQANFEKTF